MTATTQTRSLILGIQLLCLPGLAAAADCFNGPNAGGICTVPAGVTQVTIHAIGGGGGGGRDFNSAANGSGAGGGGGGGRIAAEPSRYLAERICRSWSARADPGR